MREQEDERFLKAYDECSDAIFRYCFLRLRNKELAQDVTQDTFMKTWIYVAEGGTVQNMRPFLYRTAHNLIVDYVRKRREESLDVLVESGFQPQSDEDVRLMNGLAVRELLDVMDQIPGQYRDVVYMRHVDGFSVKEIAGIIGESENVISVRIHRGLQRIRQLVDKEGRNQET